MGVTSAGMRWSELVAAGAALIAGGILFVLVFDVRNAYPDGPSTLATWLGWGGIVGGAVLLFVGLIAAGVRAGQRQ